MLITIITFVVILGLLVFVHEFGHFITAKRMGVRVDEFGFGFPPRIFGVKRGGTVYSLNAIPLGGFVKIKGEAGEDKGDSDSFAHKKIWQKVSILSAGVIMNFVLAFVLLSIGFMVGMPQEITDAEQDAALVRDARILILEVEEGSPAALAGMRSGDTLRSIDGRDLGTPEEVTLYIQDHANIPVQVYIERGNEPMDLTVTPIVYGSHANPLLGISMARTGIVRHGFFEAWYRGAVATIVLIGMVIYAFGSLLYGLFQGAGVGDQISGPVGVAILTGQVAQLGLPYLINFTAMLSINLGILNIIPFPALDGGRILFVALEKLKGRPVNPKLEGTMHTIGFSLLILLVLIVTYQDIVRYGEQIWYGLTRFLS